MTDDVIKRNWNYRQQINRQFPFSTWSITTEKKKFTIMVLQSWLSCGINVQRKRDFLFFLGEIIKFIFIVWRLSFGRKLRDTYTVTISFVLWKPERKKAIQNRGRWKYYRIIWCILFSQGYLIRCFFFRSFFSFIDEAYLWFLSQSHYQRSHTPSSSYFEDRSIRNLNIYVWNCYNVSHCVHVCVWLNFKLQFIEPHVH